jgi:hypothetical protein
MRATMKMAPQMNPIPIVIVIKSALCFESTASPKLTIQREKLANRESTKREVGPFEPSIVITQRKRNIEERSIAMKAISMIFSCVLTFVPQYGQ